jgi:hypothetical protein
MSLRLFSPQTRLWSIYWANSETVVLDVPQVGSFENKIGSFYARDTYEQKDIIVQFRWDASNPNTPFGLRRSHPTTVRPGNGTGI